MQPTTKRGRTLICLFQCFSRSCRLLGLRPILGRVCSLSRRLSAPSLLQVGGPASWSSSASPVFIPPFCAHLQFTRLWSVFLKRFLPLSLLPLFLSLAQMLTPAFFHSFGRVCPVPPLLLSELHLFSHFRFLCSLRSPFFLEAFLRPSFKASLLSWELAGPGGRSGVPAA